MYKMTPSERGRLGGIARAKKIRATALPSLRNEKKGNESDQERNSGEPIKFGFKFIEPDQVEQFQEDGRQSRFSYLKNEALYLLGKAPPGKILVFFPKPKDKERFDVKEIKRIALMFTHLFKKTGLHYKVSVNTYAKRIAFYSKGE